MNAEARYCDIPDNGYSLPDMSSITTVNATDAPSGELGQKYLVAGADVALRMWHDEKASDADSPHRRDYETVGYVVSGKVELTVDGDTVTLSEGDSWHVPKGAERSYRVLEKLTAVEATSPAARHGNDTRSV